jgi:hypothetical protein
MAEMEGGEKVGGDVMDGAMMDGEEASGEFKIILLIFNSWPAVPRSYSAGVNATKVAVDPPILFVAVASA